MLQVCQARLTVVDHSQALPYPQQQVSPSKFRCIFACVNRHIMRLYLYSCLSLIFSKFDLCFYLQAGDFELMEDGNGTMMDYQVCIFFICYPADCHKVKDGECWKLWKLGFVWWRSCWKSPQCQGRCRLGLVSFSSKTWKEGSECTADWLRSNPISALCTGCDFEDGEIIFYFSFRTAALWEAASKTTHLMAVIAGSRL